MQFKFAEKMVIGMRYRITVSVAVCALVCFAAFAPQASAQQSSAEQGGPYTSLIIRGVTVIDGSGAPAYGPVDIYVKGNRIERVSPTDSVSRGGGGPMASRGAADEKVAPDTRVIEARGMFVTPGLIDTHIHINASKDVPYEYIYKLLLGHGVTTIRVFNVADDDPKGMVAEKKKIAANQIVAPRMYVYPFWHGSDPRMYNPDGARQVVDEWHAEGVDGVKITGKPGLWPDVFKAISDEARKDGMGLAVHIGQDGVYPMNAVQIAAWGASTIEHHYGYPESSYTNQTIQNLPPDYNYSSEPDRFLETGRSWLQADLEKLHGDVINSLLDSMNKTGFIMVPTFVVYEANRDVTRAENLPWHSTYTLPVVMDSFRPNPAHHASYFYDWTSNKEADWARAYRRWMDYLRLPRELADCAEFRAMLPGDAGRLEKVGKYLIVGFEGKSEQDDWDDGSGWMGSLLPLRSDLLHGDLRCLYLGWLLSVQYEEFSEEAMEPPVPASLGELSAPLHSLIEFLGIDEDLVEVAASASSPLNAGPGRKELAKWIQNLPEAARNDLLVTAALQSGDRWRIAFLRSFHQQSAPRTSQAHTAIQPRTVRDLLTAAETRAKDKAQRLEAKRAAEAARQKAKGEADRARYLDQLEKSEGEIWNCVTAHIQKRLPKEYDKAVSLLIDLRDLAVRKQRASEFQSALEELRQAHAAKQSLINRLMKAKF